MGFFIRCVIAVPSVETLLPKPFGIIPFTRLIRTAGSGDFGWQMCARVNVPKGDVSWHNRKDERCDQRGS